MKGCFEKTLLAPCSVHGPVLRCAFSRYLVRAMVVPSQSSAAGFSSCCLQRSIISDDAASPPRISFAVSNAAIAAVNSRAR
jgi:hypothetical protein